MSLLDGLHAKAAEINKRASALEKAAEANEDKLLTDEQAEALDKEVKALESVNKQIDLLERKEAQQVEDYHKKNGTVPGKVEEVASGIEVTDECWPFGKGEGALGRQLVAIRTSKLSGQLDPRLAQLAAEPAGGSSEVGGDGGFRIQATDAGRLFDAAMGRSTLGGRVDTKPIGPNSDRLYYWQPEKYDRAPGARWGGVSAYWVPQATGVTPSHPKMTVGELKLAKLMARANVTSEQLEDVIQLEATLEDAFSEEFGWMIDNAIFEGSGNGEPTGILEHASTIVVPIEAGQTIADPLLADNILKMHSRLPERFLAGAFWMITGQLQEVLPKLELGSSGNGQLVWMPPGGLSGQQHATLMGLPVIPFEQCNVPGTKGDIVLFSPMQYVLIRKGTVKKATSMHVNFDTDEQAFRWITRVNGMPKLRETIKPQKAAPGYAWSNTIVLDTRA